MTTYYNEIDKDAAATLRELIAAGLIAPGDVDERDIRDVRPSDLRGYTQCHFFAGIGVWSYAARRAGWPDSRPLWTGSCPCPPFSSAGKKQRCPTCGSARNICHPRKTGHFVCLDCGCDRHADERHLWPEFARLIRECDAPATFGEQVASADGRLWLGAVRADLETMGRSLGGADLCAAGVGAPHIRQRLWFVTEWVADSRRKRGQWRTNSEEPSGNDAREWRKDSGHDQSSGSIGGLDDSLGAGLERHGRRHRPETGQRQGSLRPASEASEFGRLADSNGGELERVTELQGPECDRADAGWPEGSSSFATRGHDGGLANAHREQQWQGRDAGESKGKRIWPELGGCDFDCGLADSDIGSGAQGSSFVRRGNPRSNAVERTGLSGDDSIGGAGPTNGFWRDADWLFCRDGKWRPVEPGTSPLAHGAAARVGRLRAYGNAIVAQVAEAFIRAYLDGQMLHLEPVRTHAPQDTGRVSSEFDDLLGYYSADS